MSTNKPVLNANFLIASTPALKSSGRNPASVLLVPLLQEFGLNITIIDWVGETVMGEIDVETKLILDSLQEV